MPFLLGFLGLGKGIVSWLSRRSLAEIACLILCITCGVLFASNRIEKRHTAKVEAQLAKSVQLRAADRAAYVKAQHDAAVQNAAQVQQIQQHYQRNSEDERQAYLSDLAKLRASRMRNQSAPQGSPGPASPPAPDTGAPRIDETGVCVPATSDVCEAGAEIELRLMHLQNLFDQQSQVDPNK